MCLGAARLYCDTCRYSALVGFSCKKRGVCPSCQAKRAVMFAEHLHAEVLEGAPQRHIVCTIPKRLRVFFRYDRALNGILFDAAWAAIRQCLVTNSGRPDAVLTLQTAGEACRYHPHLHGLLSDGLFQPDASLMPLERIDQAALTAAFGEHVLAALYKKELITDQDVAQILSQEHTGFSFWVGEPFQDAERALFVGRYIERSPLSLQKLALNEQGLVNYFSADGQAQEFDPLDFLALLSCQVPKPDESLVRYYGHYSCRARGERPPKLPFHHFPDEVSACC